MAGVRQNRATTLKFIQSLFSSETDTLLIVKELLQNADDSDRATFTAIGVSSGLPDSSHPLLRGPALYAVNDGTFTQKNASAIITMGLSSKGDDANTVGKFGLGLKSAFSLAEAIFFLDSRLSPELEPWNPGHYDIFSPWLGGRSPRAEWEPFTTEQRQEILEHLRAQGLPDGFIVWIPLRRIEHCRVPGEERLRAIMRQFPGDSEVTLGPDVLRVAAELLPLMGRVKSIRMKSAAQAPWTTLTLSGPSRTRDLKQEAGFEQQLTGVIGAGGSALHAAYTGREVKLAVSAVTDLSESEYWPTSETVDDYGEAVTGNDPAVPHGAALWQRSPARGQAHFRGHWSVFLPVEEFGAPRRIEGNQDYTLTLHGYFFLDTKRKLIYRWSDETPDVPASEEELRAIWNARLARQTSLPFVLEGLRDITAGQEEKSIGSLTGALEEWAKDAGVRRDLTCRHQWARILVGGEFRWCLLPAQQPTLPVPGDVEVKSVLPGVVGGFALRDVRSPKLLSQKEPFMWPFAQARQVVEKVDFEDVLSSPQQMQALGALALHLPRAELQPVILPRLRAALQAVNPNLLARHKGDAARLVGSVLPHGAVQLPAEGLGADLTRRLMTLPLGVLLIPHGYTTSSLSRALTREDARHLLDAIQEAEDIAPILKFVRDNLEDQDSLSELVEGRLLLPTLLGTKGTGPWLSAAKVRELAVQGRVFRQQGEDQALLGHLQEVLGDTPLYIVQSQLLNLLELEVPTLSLSSVLHSVWQAQSLGPPEARLGLMRKLSERWRSLTFAPEHRQTLRYLLHGQPERKNDAGTTLLVTTERRGVWWRVAQLARKSLPEGWRVMNEPVEFLTDPEMKRLSVERVSPASVAPLLGSAPHLFPGGELSAQERETVILELEEVSILKQLPIFTAVDGTLVTATDGAHLEGGVDTGEALQGRVTLLRKVEDKRLGAKLRELAPPLSPHSAWNYLKNQPELWQHWPVIVKLIQGAGAVKLQQAEALPWWPRADHGGARPKDLLLYPEHPSSLEAIRSLRDAAKMDTVVGLHLHPDFITQWPHSVTHLLASEKEREESLLELLGAARTYFVGSSGTVPPPVWLRAFSGAPVELLPLLQLLPAFEKDRELQGKILKAAARPVKPEQVLWMLSYLHGQIITGDRETREAASRLYPQLLDDLRTMRVPAQSLAPLHLLNEEGEWRIAAELTRTGTQFEPKFVLNREQARALFGEDGGSPTELLLHRPQPASAETEDRLKQSTQALLRVMGEWSTVVPQEQRGAFLALLDGNPDLHEAAQPYLMNYPYQVLREEAFRGVSPGQLPRGFDTYLAMMDRVRLQVSLSYGETVTVENLLGEPLTVPYREDKQITSLFTQTHGEKPYPDGENFIYPVTLKVISLKESGLDYPDLLWQSLQWALKHSVNLLPPDLQEAYSKVVDSSQTTITATQRRLIQAAAQTWGRQLGVDKTSRVSQKLKAIDTEDRKAVQARDQGALDTARQAEENVRVYREELRSLIEGDTDTQLALLTGVRRKIQEMQYVPHSVPFELLQNADDALSEWQQLTGDASEARATFSADLTGNTLTFTHYGRPINHYGDAAGQARGFDADLEKMLTLLSSDKDEGVTGKFGLGFKSSFLLSDRPTVLSGRLAFDVLGGVYPALPAQKRLDTLREYQCRNDPPEVQGGTLIALPVSDLEVAAEVINQFGQLAPYLLAFTRSIRRIRVRQGEETRHLTRNEREVSPGVSLYGSTVGKGALTALALSGPNFKLLLPYQARGFTSLPAEVPNLWVTAPTHERLKLPFILNAPFPLDPGRAQLARNASLLETLVERLRPEMRIAFTELLRLSESGEFLEQLGWHAPTRPAFLSSLWKHLAEPLARESDSPALPLLRNLLWGTGGAIGSLAFETALIPTGLPDDFGTHVRAGTPKLRVLGFENELFKHLSQRPEFQQLYPPGSLISRETATTMEKLKLPVPEGRLGLTEVLKSLLNDALVTPERAEWLAAVLTEAVVKELTEDEANEAWLESLKFLAGDGQYRPAAYLLMPLAKMSTEEADRAAFAPPQAVIHASYSPVGLALARRVRQEVPKRQIVVWTLAATGPARKAALDYLLAHLKSTEPEAQALQQKLRGSWLEYEQLTHLPEWHAFKPDEQIDLLNLLRQLPKVVTTPVEQPAPLPTDDESLEEDDLLGDEMPTNALELIASWWEKEHSFLTARFDTWTYPDARPFVTSREYDPRDPAQRQAWLSLLMLGSLQSMGRTRPAQHKGFLKFCQEQQWLGAFSAQNAPDQVWMDSLRSYLRQQPELLKYYAWMRGFVGYYQMGRWLDEYVELFTQLDRLPETSLRTLLSLDSNPALQGSGISAPPLGRTLGIGASFVIRELLRAGVLKPEKLRPLAYMPTRRVRELVTQLTRQHVSDNDPEHGSRQIAAALSRHLGDQRATFVGAYDLPLHLLLGSGWDDQDALKLQVQVLGSPLYRRTS